jgi:hypothetical protein
VFIPNELPQTEEIKRTKDRRGTCPENFETSKDGGVFSAET